MDNKKHKSKKWKIVVIVICCLLAACLAGLAALWFYLTGGLKQVKLESSELETVSFSDISDASVHIDENLWNRIINIVFFGIDSTDEQASYGDQYRSDSIIIASIDTDRNTVKLTNILRDSKVPIEGHDPQKINAAYKYGMAPLAIKTLNSNFKLNITDYVTVDFASIQNIVDSLGGIEIELSEAESAQIEGTVPGRNTLNGEQAVLYSRIRKIDSDYYRASRQQNVISAILGKLQETPLLQIPGKIKDLMTCVETSLSYGDILKIVMALDIRRLNIVYNTIPDYQYETDLWGGIDSDHGEWVYIYDLDKASERLHGIIYGS